MFLSHKGGRGGAGLQHYGDRLSIYYSEVLYEPQGAETSSVDVLTAEVGAEHSRLDEDAIMVMIELEDWIASWVNYLEDPSVEFSITDDCDTTDWTQP